MGRTPYVQDYHGNGNGLKITLKKALAAVCVLCGTRKYVARNFLYRKTREMCPCGGTLELANTVKKRLKLEPTFHEKRRLNKDRVCLFCKAKLRIGNESKTCSARSCRNILAYLYPTQFRSVRKMERINEKGEWFYKITGVLSRCIVETEIKVCCRAVDLPLYLPERRD